MLLVSLPGLSIQKMIVMMTGGLGASSVTMPTAMTSWGTRVSEFGKGKMNYLTATTARNTAVKKMNLGISPLASASLEESPNSPRAIVYKEVLEAARDKFTREISFQSKDKNISLAKALLYVAAEDEAFLAFNREIDALSIHNESRDIPSASNAHGWDCVEAMPMAGKNINEWLAELDAISKEVEAELVSRDIGCDLVEVLEAVNKVLFESRAFKRSSVPVDSKCFYLHSVLSSGCASAILLSVIYIEVCRRLNLTIVGSRVGENFLIWPPTGNPEELFRATSGHSLFGIVNGKCVEDPRSKASDINSNSLLGLDIATNRDIIGIALANLIRLYWKRASKMNYGLMLTSPLRSFHKSHGKFNDSGGLNVPLLRPQELRLAIMASERLLILQPHNWSLRRDYGMMLYYNREYEAVVQELSICMAFAPEEEAEILEPFVEKLHLMRLEMSWKSLGQQKASISCFIYRSSTARAKTDDSSRNSAEIVCEIRGGRKVELVPDYDKDEFIVPNSLWSWWSKGEKSKSLLTLEDIWVKCGDLVSSLMLPEGFPESVTSDYLEYSLWRGVQGIAAQVSGVLATQVMWLDAYHSL